MSYVKVRVHERIKFYVKLTCSTLDTRHTHKLVFNLDYITKTQTNETLGHGRNSTFNVKSWTFMGDPSLGFRGPGLPGVVAGGVPQRAPPTPHKLHKARPSAHKSQKKGLRSCARPQSVARDLESCITHHSSLTTDHS